MNRVTDDVERVKCIRSCGCISEPRSQKSANSLRTSAGSLSSPRVNALRPRKCRFTVAVAIEYASNRDCTGLAPATASTLESAIAFLNGERENDCVLAYCNANLSKAMRPQEAESKKSAILHRLLKNPVERVVVEAGNSIEEAKNIHDALVEKSIQPRKIIIFCDIQHERRLRMIWPHVFPGVEIEIRPGRYIYGRDYKQIFLRHEFTWRLANVAGLVAMKIFGIERVASIKEP